MASAQPDAVAAGRWRQTLGLLSLAVLSLGPIIHVYAAESGGTSSSGGTSGTSGGATVTTPVAPSGLGAPSTTGTPSAAAGPATAAGPGAQAGAGTGTMTIAPGTATGFAPPLLRLSGFGMSAGGQATLAYSSNALGVPSA